MLPESRLIFTLLLVSDRSGRHQNATSLLLEVKVIALVIPVANASPMTAPSGHLRVLASTLKVSADLSCIVLLLQVHSNLVALLLAHTD